MAESEHEVQSGAERPHTPAEKQELKTGLAAVAAVGLGVALIEVEWVPALLLGAAAVVAPQVVPGLGRKLRPMVRSAVKAGYAATRKTREWVAEAGEQMSDIVAEVRAAALEEGAETHGAGVAGASGTPVGTEAHPSGSPAIG